MKHGLFAAAALAWLAASVPHAALADEETDALRKEVQMLEARIAELEKREKAHEQQAAAPATAGGQKLEQRVAIVERNQEVAQEEAKTKAAGTPTVEVGSKGLIVTSQDKQYSVNVHGYVQADDRTFLDNGQTGAVGAGNTSTFLIRSARPIIDAKMTDYFNARFMIDFGKGQTTLLDAYGDFHPMPGNNLINLRMGETKSPVGLERWQAEQDVLFVERGQTTNLVPYRDIGVMAMGQLIPDQLEYQLGVMNGAADLQANTGDNDNRKDVVSRVFAYPFRWAQIPMLQGLGFGVGGTYGGHEGNSTAATSGLTTGYMTTGQRTYFTYAAGAYANGPQWRVNPQAMYYNGPFSLLGEYVANGQEIKHNTTDFEVRNNAWMGIATYVITGEDASFDGVRPAHNFNPAAGDWGAFELVGRMSELNVDKKAFTGGIFASSATSAREAMESTFGATWYFNNSVKLNLDYSWTTFDGGAAGGLDRKDEKVILTRTQLKF